MSRRFKIGPTRIHGVSPLVLLGILTTVIFGQPAKVTTAADRLLQADRDFAKASENKGAAEAFARYLAEDAMQLPGGAQPLFGRKTIVDNMGSGYILKWDPKGGSG
jgi:hypothetical protein